MARPQGKPVGATLAVARSSKMVNRKLKSFAPNNENHDDYLEKAKNYQLPLVIGHPQGVPLQDQTKNMNKSKIYFRVTESLR